MEEKTLESIRGKSIFLEHGVLDFTNPNIIPEIIIHRPNTKITITLTGNLKELCGKLQYIFSDCIIIGWNIKNIFTYFLAKTKMPFEINAKIFDLKLLENYLAINEDMPKNYEEASKRLKFIINGNYENAKNIYSSIYTPLLQAVSQIEVNGVYFKGISQRLHPYYEISGQTNGRMKCSEAFKYSFNPHTLTEDDKNNIRPAGEDDLFIELDYKHMEVSILQWLSKDDILGSIMDSGADLYEGIWETITSTKCNAGYRQKCKNLFLPIVFGQGITSLAEKNGISEVVARQLMSNIYKKFPTAMNWIENQQRMVGEVGVDILGRSRKIDAPYLMRNFCVQSPACTFTFLKLIKLYNNIRNTAKIGMHIHDGFILFSNVSNLKKNRDIAVSVLQSPEKLFDGLKLKVNCQWGGNLSKLTCTM